MGKAMGQKCGCALARGKVPIPENVEGKTGLRQAATRMSKRFRPDHHSI